MMNTNLASKTVSDPAWQASYPADVRWDAHIETSAVHEILDRAAVKFARHKAIDFGAVQLSYAQLGSIVNKIAAGLQGLGVGKGVKVGLFLPNTHYSVAFYYGILKAGGTVVNYNPLYVERELVAQVEDSETDFLVTLDEPGLFAKAEGVRAASRLKKLIACPSGAGTVSGADIVAYADLIDNDGKPAAFAVDVQKDIAVLQYTGGTTGTPKGAMLTHANISANMAQMALWHGPVVSEGAEKIVCAIPLFHVFAMTVIMNLSLHLGMEIIIVSKFAPDTMIELLKEKRPTLFPAVPAIFNAIAHHPAAEGLDLSFMKFCLSGGAPLPQAVRSAFEGRTGAKVGEGYGLTEASPVVACNPFVGEVRTGSIGLPIPGTFVEIISMEDGVSALPTGERGEVCVSGPQVMAGYYRREGESADVIKNGRLHTGDVGYMDSDGYIHLVDRLKDLIIVRGYNVYPTQVEAAVYMHPAVQECIVAGVPDDERGESVQAWIAVKAGMSISAEEMSAFLNDKISPIEIPRAFVIGHEPLPKTAVGKLSRKLLLELAGIKKA